MSGFRYSLPRAVFGGLEHGLSSWPSPPGTTAADRAAVPRCSPGAGSPRSRLALVLIVVDKYWPLGVEAWGWAAGALAVGLAAAAVGLFGALQSAGSRHRTRPPLRTEGTRLQRPDPVAGRPRDRGGRGPAGRRRRQGRADRRRRAVRRQAAAASAVAAGAGRAGRAGRAADRAGASKTRRRRPPTRPPSSRCRRRPPRSAASLPIAANRRKRRGSRTPTAVPEARKRREGVEQRADQGKGDGEDQRPFAAAWPIAASRSAGRQGQGAARPVEEHRSRSGRQVCQGPQPRRS